MSTIEPFEAMAEPWDDLETAPGADTPRLTTPVVQRGSIAGRSLTAVIAIMTFLAALTTGATIMVLGASRDWRSAVGREVTVQVRPVAGRDIEADVAKAADVVRASPGVAEVRPYSKQESASLVEPWLGSGLPLDELPMPRLIVVKLQSGARPDFTSLRQALAAQVPSASLDDHRRWIDRMRTMAGTAALGGIVVFGLVLAVTVLSVAFATLGAMATNRPVIEVLHYVGATDAFILRQFQHHFLVLGLKGGAIGGGLAIALFGFLEAASAWLAGTPGGEETTALLGGFALPASGYVAILAEIVFMAAITALASRRIVNRTLESMD